MSEHLKSSASAVSSRVRRRDFSIALCTCAAVWALPAPGATQSDRSPEQYPQTQREKAAGVTPLDTNFPPGNVCRYGADPTGEKDCTAAFNAATFHDLKYSLDGLLNEIIVPAGKFRIDGTVYVRKGQRLRGALGATYIVCNNAGQGPTFKLGWGFIEQRPQLDAGGEPLSVESLLTMGGPAGGCIDCTQVAGAFLKDLFISNAALGMRIQDSGDLNVENVVFDQGLTGISIAGSQNCQFSMLKFFLINYDLSISAGTHDCQWSNCHSEYNRYSSVTFVEGAVGIRNLKFTDCQFIYNPTSAAHYKTFLGAIHNRAPGVTARFDDCTFSNMPGFAYVHGDQTGSRLDFANCLFDGERTGSSYAQSTAAAAVSTQNEAVLLTNCSFRNLKATPVFFGGSQPAILELRGGDYYGNGGASFLQIVNQSAQSSVRISGLRGDAHQTLVNEQSAVPVTARECADWFGPVRESGSRRYVLLPYQRGTVFQILLTANSDAGGSQERRSIMLLAAKNNIRGNGERSVIVTSPSLQGAPSRDGGDALNVEFAKIGGGVDIPRSDTGSVAVSWPKGYEQETLDVQMF